MDNNNVHTSVVIELANQEEPEELKSYNVDSNELEIPKDYVIDQIFCGENITVYALFEIPELTSKKSDCELPEVQNSAANDDFRFIHRNSFKKTINKKSNGHRRKLPPKDSDEDNYFALNKCSQKKSLYCLKHLDEKYEVPVREESKTELKVLFSKDFISKSPRGMKFKGVSKGVNTDIAQSPKLIDDVQKALTLNFSIERNDGKAMETTKILTSKSSYETIDVEVQQSFSSFASGGESRKYSMRSSPNFLFVPLLMMEERFMSHFQKPVKSSALPEEKTLENRTEIAPKKVSLGTNTDASEPFTSENEDRREIQSSYSSQCESVKTERSEVCDAHLGRKNKNLKSHLKKKDKDTILNEIKKLQGKLSALIKSIEYNELCLSTNEEEDSEIDKRTSEEVMKKLEKSLEPLLAHSELCRKNQSRFDDIPIFSPLSFPSHSKNFKSKKKAQGGDRKNLSKKVSLDLVKSVSSSFLSSKGISGIQSVLDGEKSKVKLKNVFSGLNIDWELKTSKCVGPSKSDTNNRCTLPFPKYNCIKKSMSFDSRDDKGEICCLKKMKTSSFKFEGSLKANMRIIQSGEVHLGDNLTALTREMGDEANRKPRVSLTELKNLVQDPKKEEAVFLKESALDIKKSLNEEEGDAKSIYPKEGLMTQKFVQNSAIHFCSTNTIVSDGTLKNVKHSSPTRGKIKTVAKGDELGTKACSDPEKSTTPNKTYRKTVAMDSDAKKEVKLIKKLSTKNKFAEKKPERREPVPHELARPKSISGCRKFTVKGTAESKLHVDKLIKVENEAKSEIVSIQKAMKSGADEKQGGKVDLRLPRPQKRELPENPPEVTSAGDKKEVEKKPTKKKSATAVHAESRPKKTRQDVDVKENLDVITFNVSEEKREGAQEEKLVDTPVWLPSNSSSVVVELFSKKPTSVEEFYTEVSQETNLINITNGGEKSCWNKRQANENFDSQEKPIVKSVWALTKVLLYEDGTKKLEVLEASLTPPGYSLNLTDKNTIQNNPK